METYESGEALEQDLQMNCEHGDDLLINQTREYRNLLINQTSDFIGFTSVLQKYQSQSCLKNLTLLGSNTGQGIIPESNEEIKDFFEAVGQMEMLECLYVENIAMPLSLLTCLFKNTPHRFRYLHLCNVRFFPVGDACSEIEDFISTIKKIPKLHSIQTEGLLKMPQPTRTNKDLASELVKLSLVNIIVSIDIDSECPFSNEAWRVNGEVRPRMGASVIVNDPGLATEALNRNDKLEHLQIVDWAEEIEESLLEKKNKMSSFLEALVHCKTLDALYLLFDLNRPSWKGDLLAGLASVLSELPIQKLVIMNIGESSWRKVEKDFAVGLTENYAIQGIEFSERGYQYHSEKIDFYLYLNHSHHGFGSRKKIELNASTTPVDKWVDIFARLGKKTDLIGLSALYYYLHVYFQTNACTGSNSNNSSTLGEHKGSLLGNASKNRVISYADVAKKDAWKAAKLGRK